MRRRRRIVRFHFWPYSPTRTDSERMLAITNPLWSSPAALGLRLWFHMTYGCNTCTSQVRRVHLVWQVESKGVATSAQEQLNQLLEDDTMDDGYILHISIYVAHDLKQHKQSFGELERACCAGEYRLMKA
ncbi:uncharacterized protein BDV17DRAFT_2575 [Aspergillus undulatus]|uniref:uncharacterized protein n=1 Tax=Aspergillus undulatus TaxID=1810928 RepID=UPI003CCDCDD5